AGRSRESGDRGVVLRKKYSDPAGEGGGAGRARAVVRIAAVKPRIAFPEPHSGKPEYNQRSIPQYAHAVEASGGELVVIPLNASNEEIAKMIARCHAALSPGSPADVDPQKFDQAKDPHTNPADPKRDNLDELLLQDAFNMRKPLLGICYGIQSLNVWRTGTLKQHITTSVNHEAGREAPVAHK